MGFWPLWKIRRGSKLISLYPRPHRKGVGCNELKYGWIAFTGESVLAGTKTYNAKANDVEHLWHWVDAEDQIVGRLASEIAVVLMGKHRPTFTPNVDTGDFVVVVNAAKVVFTGKKWEQKEYTWYTGHPGLRSITAGARLKKQPELILREAVRRMLPKNKLGTVMLSKLKLFAGPEHTHQAQTPTKLEITTKK